MTLTSPHLDIAKSISTQIWERKLKNKEHHRDYILQKLEKLKSISSSNPENIWAIINQFDLRNQMKLWKMAHNLGKYNIRTKKPNILAQELANWMDTEYLPLLEKECGIKFI